MFINIKNWNWGRVVYDNYSLLYLYIDYFDKGIKPFKKLTIYKEGKIEKDIDDFNFEIKNKMNFSSFNMNKEFVIETDGVKMVCRNRTKLEDEYSINRYLSDFELTLNGKSVLTNNLGISESFSLKKFVKEN